MRRKVGFIGLGDQGAPMAQALAPCHDLFLWARREASYAPFEGLEFHRAKSATALANQVDVLCLCLLDDAGLDELLFEEGVADALPVNALVINHATGDPVHAAEVTARLGEKLIRSIDAPVSGGHAGAAKGALTCFLGGDEDAVSAARSVIARHSSHIFHMGPAGSGQFTKLLNNALTVSNLRNVVEVFRLADDAGVDRKALQAALAYSSGGSFILQAIGRQIGPAAAEHIARLNVKDVEEFASAMAHVSTSADAIVNWAIKGPEGLPLLAHALATGAS